jgi:hypothetical protein
MGSTDVGGDPPFGSWFTADSNLDAGSIDYTVLARRQPIVKLAIVSSAFLCMSACVISRAGTATDHPGAMGR